MRVLVVAAHYDDEVLGCGGTIAKLTDEGHEVHVLSCARKRLDNVMSEEINLEYAERLARACQILGVETNYHLAHINDEEFPRYRWELLKKVESVARDVRPDLVLTHCAEDYNQDHRIVNDVCQIAFRPWTCAVRAMYFFEVPSSTRPDFAPDVFVPLSREHYSKKFKAWAQYEREHRPAPHPRCVYSIDCLMRRRGSHVGHQYAEAFKVAFQKGMLL